MAQKITGYIKLQIPAGKATPAPPVGPALGQHGVNIMDFTKQFNEKTQEGRRSCYPGCYHRISGSFFHLCHKNSAGSRFLSRRLASIQSGSGVPNKTKVAQISKAAC